MSNIFNNKIDIDADVFEENKGAINYILERI